MSVPIEVALESEQGGTDIEKRAVATRSGDSIDETVGVVHTVDGLTFAVVGQICRLFCQFCSREFHLLFQILSPLGWRRNLSTNAKNVDGRSMSEVEYDGRVTFLPLPAFSVNFFQRSLSAKFLEFLSVRCKVLQHFDQY